MKRIWLLVVVGCGLTGRYMPKDIQGDLSLAVKNSTGMDLCTLLVSPHGAKDPANYNLLRTLMASSASQMKPGEKAEFKIKPGPYDLYIESCERGFQAERQLAISGPTYLELGEASAAAVPAGYAAVGITSGALTSCVVDGRAEGEGGRPCCSGHKHFDADLHDDVCEK